ncbi:MAG: SDR family oxidoreductase, partial [Pseudonocardiaceae bacterium]
DASVAWPAYDWMGVSKAALEAVGRYLARYLGPAGIRVNLVSAGPLDTPAAGGLPGFAELSAAWQKQAPLGWDVQDPKAVADVVCFLLSDLARAMTGEILHVDGGFHAIGAAEEEATEDGEASAEGGEASAEGEDADADDDEPSGSNGSGEDQPAEGEQS